MILHCVLFLPLIAYSSALAHATRADEVPYAGSIYAAKLAGAGSELVDKAYPFQFPEILGIFSSDDSLFLGQTSIIYHNMTITAASAFWKMEEDEIMLPDEFYLAGGSLDILAPDERHAVGHHVSFVVECIHVHPGFAFFPVSQMFEKDIALVVPEEYFSFNETDDGPYFLPLPLDKKGNNKTSDIKLTGITAGWGMIEDSNGQAIEPENDMLNYINYTFTKHADCQKLYASMHKINNKVAPFNVGPHMVCMNTTATKMGLCTDDTGAALRVVEKFIPRIVGIASKQLSDDCPNKLPDVYMRTAYFVDWIASKGGPPVRK